MHTSHIEAGWERQLNDRLPLFGHRNWVVIADAAYPSQTKPGIETILANEGQIAAVRKTMHAMAAFKHIRAHVYADQELDFVAENDAPGVSDYRRQLHHVLYGVKVNYLPHEEIIAKLDQSAQVFRILILKTEMMIPYTSIFFELDCGYWNAEAEERLRISMRASESR